MAMSARINNFFTVKRDSTKTSLKRAKLSPDPIEAQSQSQRVRNGPSPPSKTEEHTIKLIRSSAKKNALTSPPVRKTRAQAKACQVSYFVFYVFRLFGI